MPVRRMKATKKPASDLILVCFLPRPTPTAKMETNMSQTRARMMMAQMESTRTALMTSSDNWLSMRKVWQKGWGDSIQGAVRKQQFELVMCRG